MAWNKMFNAFLRPAPDERHVAELAKNFTFGDRITLRKFGLGKVDSSYSWSPATAGTKAGPVGDTSTFSFPGLPRKFGVPQVGATAKVTCESFAITPATRKDNAALLGATDSWPVADAKMAAIARQITGDKASERDKVAALLAWHLPGKNLRYAGETGSRYGVQPMHSQGFGHSWDFSDSFVTLCRAAKIPCRQVLGWLHGQSGHVWAEVLLEGEGWMQVDPTAGMGCDCRYIPLMVTEDGQVTLVYTSAVRIRELAPGKQPEK